MGLIRASLQAFNSTMADQWKEYFTVDSLDNETILKKGHIQTTSKSSNSRGNSNVITQGSAISVNEGQAIIIVDDGAIIDFCAEPGIYTFEDGENTIFEGKFTQSIKESFETFKKRFTYGGDTGRNTKVYYFNLKALYGQKFGTSSPLIYDDPVYQSISIRFFGQAELILKDPIVFYKNVAGNVAESMSITELWNEQLRSEFMMNMNQTFASLALQNVKYNQIPQQQTKIAEIMNDILDEMWLKNRGIEIQSVGIDNITLNPEDKEKIDKIDDMRLMSNTQNAAGRMTAAMANAMEGAAENEGGSFMGFAGLNAAANASANNVSNLQQMAQNERQQSAQTSNWTCSCGTSNSGNFCTNCGSAKPVSNNWTCSCGTSNSGNFCTNCGSAKPVSNNWTCSCGTSNSGNFCTNCGSKK